MRFEIQTEPRPLNNAVERKFLTSFKLNRFLFLMNQSLASIMFSAEGRSITPYA